MTDQKQRAERFARAVLRAYFESPDGFKKLDARVVAAVEQVLADEAEENARLVESRLARLVRAIVAGFRRLTSTRQRETIPRRGES